VRAPLDPRELELMIKHIVFFRLKDQAEGGTKAENAARVKRDLEALAGRIPGLLRLEVGIDVDRSPAAFDVALYSEFTDQAALDAYQKHPEHLAAAAFIGKVRSERAVVDYVA
jgi:quinol monooxygenase YgiN